jgi:hypothetical protein
MDKSARKLVGGHRRARRPGEPFYAADRPGACSIERIRKADRDYGVIVTGTGRIIGGSGGRSPTGTASLVGVSSLKTAESGAEYLEGDLVLHAEGTASVEQDADAPHFTFYGWSVLSVSALPGTPDQEMIYWRTSDDSLWWYNGTGWVRLDTSTALSATLTDNATTNVDVTVAAEVSKVHVEYDVEHGAYREAGAFDAVVISTNAHVVNKRRDDVDTGKTVLKATAADVNVGTLRLNLTVGNIGSDADFKATLTLIDAH